MNILSTLSICISALGALFMALALVVEYRKARSSIRQQRLISYATGFLGFVVLLLKKLSYLPQGSGTAGFILLIVSLVFYYRAESARKKLAARDRA